MFPKHQPRGIISPAKVQVESFICTENITRTSKINLQSNQIQNTRDSGRYKRVGFFLFIFTCTVQLTILAMRGGS